MIRIALGLSCLLLTVPAHAADLGTIGCVGDKLDGATRDKVAEEVKANLGVTGPRGSYSAPVVTAVKAAAASCATDNKWTPAAARSAMLYTLAKLSLPVVSAAAAERGLDPAVLEAQFLALPEDARSKPLTPELYRQLADAAIPEGEMRTQANGALLHTFFEFENILQYASTDFAAAEPPAQ